MTPIELKCLQDERHDVKNDHAAIELTPPIEYVRRVAPEQTLYLYFGDHFGGEHERAYQVAEISEKTEIDVFVVFYGCGRVSTYGYEAAQGAYAHNPLHPRLVYPLEANGRVYAVVELLL